METRPPKIENPPRRVPLDLSNCKDEQEGRVVVEDYWTPKVGVDFTSRKPRKRPQTPPPDSPIEESMHSRRHSDPSIWLEASTSPSRSPESPPGYVGTVSTTSPGRPPPTPDSLRPEDTLGLKDNVGFPSLGPVREALDWIFKTGLELRPSSRKIAELEETRRKQEEKAIQDALEGARRKRDDRRLGRRDPLKDLVQPLNSKWEAIVNDTKLAHRDKTITKSLEGTELRHKDFATLLGQCAWLNDEIINTYIEWVVVAANEAAAREAKAWGDPPSTVPKFIAHNSFFFMNLKKKGPQSTDRLMKRKKAEGVKLLQADTVFVPICQGSHWTIGVVRPYAKTIEYFDSMGGSSSEFIRQMREWLKHQLGPAYNEKEWTTPRTSCAIQTNGYDCGVFVCTNAFCVASGIKTSCYVQEDMTLQRKCIAAILINRGFSGDFQWGRGGLLPVAEYMNWGPEGLQGEISRIRESFGGHSFSSNHGIYPDERGHGVPVC